MMEWSTACLDWERRIVARESLIACPPLFPEVAAEAWERCSSLCLTDVMGQPLLGEASLPWVREFIMAVFGAEDPETGRRHINEFMLMVSKKNAKSTIAAAIMLTALLMNWRQSAELLILSPSPITYAARDAIGTSLAAQEFSGRFFTGGGNFDYALKAPGRLTDKQLKELKASLIARAQNGGRGPLLLSGGLEPAKLSVDSKDAEILATRLLGIEEICSALGVPPHMVGHTQKSTSFGKRQQKEAEILTKRTVTAITHEFTMGKMAELDAIERVAAVELAAFAGQAARLQQQLAIESQKKNSLKEQEALRAQIAAVGEAHTDRELQLSRDLELQDKKMLDVLDAKYDAAMKAADASRVTLRDQERQNEIAALTLAATANQIPGTVELRQQVLELQRGWAYETAAQLERQAVTQQTIDLSGATSEALRQQAAAMRAVADSAFTGATLQGATDTLREIDAYLDPAKATDFGTALKESFGAAGSALGQLAGAFKDYAQQHAVLAKLQAKLDAEKKVGHITDADYIKRTAALERDRSQKQIGAFASVASAAKGFFKEHSKGYKAMEAAEKVFRAFEMAMAAQSMLEQILAFTTVTAAKETATAMEIALAAAGVPPIAAAEAAKQAVYAKTGLAAALTLPPPASFVAFAAVAAMLAAIGVAAGGGDAASAIPDRDIRADIQGAQGTGTVLGDEGAKSESLGKAIELLASNSRIELEYTQRMLIALHRVRDGIEGFTAAVARTQGIRGTKADQARFGIGGSTEMVDSGMMFYVGQTIGSIIAEGIKGEGYTTTFTKDKGRDGYAQIFKTQFGAELKGSMEGVVVSMVDSLISAADALKLNDAGMIDRILAVMPSIGDTTDTMRIMQQAGGGLVSLAGLSGDDITKELEAVFSSIGDQIAQAAFPAIAEFQIVGEGMFETVMRVSSGVEKANYALEQFGIDAISYTDILNKTGDIATEIVRQSVGALEVLGDGAMTGVGRILDAFSGGPDDLIELYTALMDVRAVMRSVGAEALDLNVAMVRGAGGLDKLKGGLDSYYDKFFSEAEQAAAQQARLAEQFGVIGVAVPQSMEAFRGLVESLDTTTDAGAKLFGQLMGVAGAFADAAGAVGDTLDRLTRAQNLASDYLTPGELRANAAGRIQQTAGKAGVDLSFEQILGYTRQRFADDLRSYYAAGDTAMVDLMLSVSDDFLSVSKSTTAALQEQQQLASKTLADINAGINSLQQARKSAGDLSRSIGQSMGGTDTGERELWAAVNGTGDLQERIKAAGDLKAIIEKSGAAQMQAHKTALSNAQALLNIGKQLRSYVDGLKLGSLSALTPAEQMAEATRQYNDTLRKAQAGDADAQKGLQAIASSYLQLAQQYDPGAYGSIFGQVTNQLDAFGSALMSQAEADVQRQQALVSAAEAANGLSAAQIAKLGELKGAVDSISALADSRLVVAQAQAEIANAKLSSIDALLAAANDVWSYLPGQSDSLSSIDAAMREANATWASLPDDIARALAGLIGVTVPAFASGGSHTGGARLVGERGPELEVTGPARIFNASQTAAMLGGGSNNAELVAEIRGLRAEVASLRQTVAQGDQANVSATLQSAESVQRGVAQGIAKGARTNKLQERATA